MPHRSKSRYEFIVFDLGNTLIRFDHNISAKKLANLFRLDSKKIYDTFFDSDITRDFESGRISSKEFYKRASALLKVKMPYKDFVDIWNDIFWEDAGMCELARELKKSYKLFLLSNINRLHFEHIRGKFDIISIFDELILSFVVGAIKPEQLIYDNVVERAGGDRSKILYIDDREDLVRESTRLGIDSIRFNNNVAELRTILSSKGVI
jgi:putative hydrolase of the HAD superfamily